MDHHARILSTAAAEAVGEPDVIARRPEVIEMLRELASDPELPSAVARVVPEVFANIRGELEQLADELEPYRTEPLDDSPELVERLALIAWALQRANDTQATSEFSALAHA
ncbi:hypothetical protein OJ997_27645 [Solirubrobacter phytolaccae]|uniref:Uncharacterized protein n=1 Tax=Solirubrobacter phytolaccae TaxID=1404360 RepID=A0A9X3SA47_9ACTN|nr:hypothetical protein [Solirubrobacter phytolaccae]MDA0184114.1 hypothetical protein [Solirubrobacter phytolaccae]